MRLPRALVPASTLPDAPGARIRIVGDEHHHLARVLRVRAGDRLAVFDGEGRGFVGLIEDVGAEATRVQLLTPDDAPVEPRTDVTLLQALPQHPDRMDLVVQKATECGVLRILPITSERTVRKASAARSAGRLSRWRRIAAEAAKQSGRRVVPRVEGPRSLPEALGGVGEGARLILATEGTADDLTRETLGEAGAVHLLVGPEGGWSGADRACADSAGFRAVTLGPRILRTETAGIVGVALVLHLSGDLRATRPPGATGGSPGFDSRSGRP